MKKIFKIFSVFLALTLFTRNLTMIEADEEKIRVSFLLSEGDQSPFIVRDCPIDTDLDNDLEELPNENDEGTMDDENLDEESDEKEDDKKDDELDDKEDDKEDEPKDEEPDEPEDDEPIDDEKPDEPEPEDDEPNDDEEPDEPEDDEPNDDEVPELDLARGSFIQRFISSQIVTVSALEDKTSLDFGGAKFQVHNNVTGELIGEFVTDVNGLGYIDLPIGEYVMSQSSAPKGYKVSTEKLEFELLSEHVDCHNSISWYNVKGVDTPVTEGSQNKKETSDVEEQSNVLPSTGLSSALLDTSIALLGTGIVLISKEKFKRK